MMGCVKNLVAFAVGAIITFILLIGGIAILGHAVS